MLSGTLTRLGFYPFQFPPGYSTSFTPLAQNGAAIKEKEIPAPNDLDAGRGMTDDIFDETYREKAGPKPATVYVWRNIILMALLHLSALYSLCLIPSAKFATVFWGKRGVSSASFQNSLIVLLCPLPFRWLGEISLFSAQRSALLSKGFGGD